jgi:hypothetical protein
MSDGIGPADYITLKKITPQRSGAKDVKYTILQPCELWIT